MFADYYNLNLSLPVRGPEGAIKFLQPVSLLRY